ncbi:MAG: hypothetical protein HYS78_01815 [Parcubacteria group bacterium]|nr:hypothetical protein [Parcubacteria group bacterium]
MFQAIATTDIIRESLLTLWASVAAFVPKLVAAVVVFLIGWLIAVLLGRVAYHLIRVLQINKALEGLGFRAAIERGGLHLDAPKFFDELVKWFFIIVFLMAATNIVGLTQVTEFLAVVVFYLPNVIVAALVLLIGVLVARFLEHSVRVSVKAARLASANFLAVLARWSVLVFSFLIALDQLKVAPEIIRIFVMGVVAMIAIAGGLAFGMGGRDLAGDWLSNLKKRVQD